MLCGGFIARSARRIDPHIRRVRGCLTLMLVLPANAVSHEHRHATQAHEWQLSACLSLQRARVVRFRCANGFSAIHRSGSPCVSALAGIETSSLRGSRRRTRLRSPLSFHLRLRLEILNFSFPGCTEPTLALVPLARGAATAKPRPAAARVRREAELRPDSIVCRLCIRCRTPLHRFRGMLSLIPKSSKQSRPSKFQRTPPGKNWEVALPPSSLRSSRGSNGSQKFRRSR